MIGEHVVEASVHLASAATPEERLITFEIGGALFALPVDGVLEVTDMAEVRCVPTIPPSVAGIVNYHGDALPVVHRCELLGLAEGVQAASAQVLVVTDRRTATARLGLRVDRVVALVSGSASPSQGADPVAEHRTMNGRVASILDPRALVERAREIIETSVCGTE